MSRLNATTTESVLDNIEVQRALNISYTKGYLDGKKAQKKEDIINACNWIFGYIRSTDMKKVSAYDVEKEFRKFMEDEK